MARSLPNGGCSAPNGEKFEVSPSFGLKDGVPFAGTRMRKRNSGVCPAVMKQPTFGSHEPCIGVTVAPLGEAQEGSSLPGVRGTIRKPEQKEKEDVHPKSCCPAPGHDGAFGVRGSQRASWGGRGGSG